MREINNGSIIRYSHMNGASAFFILLFIHIAKGFYYGGYCGEKRISLWNSGVVIILLLMAIAFLGYVLP
jgi:ubiquinol-cytochrome c reductase cytochrome b subunit